MQVAGGGNAGNKKRRHSDTLFLQVRLAPPFGFTDGALHPGYKACLSRVAQHIEVGFRHDVADTLRHVST
ncbi:MAG: hypothetical protein J6X86_08170 [Bacteroidales bacterium]|nr:hypothetical protein [Bacteroidales bacterium]